MELKDVIMIVAFGLFGLGAFLLFLRPLRQHTSPNNTLDTPPNSSTKTKGTSRMSNTLQTIGTAPGSTTTLKVTAFSAEVTVQYGHVQELVVEANNPEEFDIIQDGEQLRVKEKSGSGSICGGVVIGNIAGGSLSNVVQSSRGGRNTVSINGKTYVGQSVSVINGQVFIDGKPAQEDSTSEPPKDRNKLQITVPYNYFGELRLTGEGQSIITMPTWTGPKLSLNLSGQSRLVAQAARIDTLACELSGQSKVQLAKVECPKARIRTSGQSHFSNTYLDSHSLDVESSGQSVVHVSDGKTSVRTTLEASGMASITCEGHYANVYKDRSGMAKLFVTP